MLYLVLMCINPFCLFLRSIRIIVVPRSHPVPPASLPSIDADVLVIHFPRQLFDFTIFPVLELRYHSSNTYRPASLLIDMASTVRMVPRISRPTAVSSLTQSSHNASALPRHYFQRTSRRSYASAGSTKPSSNVALWTGLGVIAAGGAGYFLYSSGVLDAGQGAGKTGKQSSAGKAAGSFSPQQVDYQEVYDAVAKRLIEHDDYDDGSYGPVVLRLGWHASGTYDAATGTGGSNGATMRFAPESDHGANAGLKAARDFLQPVKGWQTPLATASRHSLTYFADQFPWITYSDLWTLSAVCAIQEMAGPVIPWRPGRSDRDASWCSPDGRLPDGGKKQDHLRAIFGRMGFSDQEIVALSGAHALGRCHSDRSGFDGPWTFSPTMVTNDYYKLLLDEKWQYRKWDGPRQFQDQGTKSLMMLPTDMALIQDKRFKPIVEKYARGTASSLVSVSASGYVNLLIHRWRRIP